MKHIKWFDEEVKELRWWAECYPYVLQVSCPDEDSPHNDGLYTWSVAKDNGLDFDEIEWGKVRTLYLGRVAANKSVRNLL